MYYKEVEVTLHGQIKELDKKSQDISTDKKEVEFDLRDGMKKLERMIWEMEKHEREAQIALHVHILDLKKKA